ncbi:M20/M25/M40 family metallo-hydrolase [Rhizobium sp. BE258]|uniref:M20/M25/M40 family metallo-hydrolase n=1 Tax=Rhizobium sp. BE258 TaxID=2817722 RepID=UPI00285B09C9|nr:M20/M25/M40 family metallo-hydrolase [Rhizobium sp. BE258]MDR7147739.1 succinyl-diaminopimelate desuccinylase [Rhizobium sp. BE258]
MDTFNTDKVNRDALSRLARQNRQSVIDHTLELLARPSDNPPGDTRSVADYLVNVLEQIPGVTVERHETAPLIQNVVAHVSGRGPGKRLIFNGHLDTFPMGDRSAWTRNPKGEVFDGKIFGLGVSDMKGGLAACLFAFENMAASRDDWAGEVVLTFAGDEETMGVLGSKFLIENVPHARGDAVICADVGSPAVLRIGEKGLLWLKISATGKTAHAAHVHRGDSAIEKLLVMLSHVKALTAMRPKGRDDVEKIVRKAAHISEAFSGAGESDVLLSLTATIGTISGGRLSNLIADHAEATADIRIPLGISTDEVLTALNAAVADLQGVKIEVVRRYEASWTDPQHPLVKTLTRAACEVLRIDPVVNMRVGASDSRLHRAAGMATVVCGLTPNNMGSADEYVDVDELTGLGELLTLAAYDFLTA